MNKLAKWIQIDGSFWAVCALLVLPAAILAIPLTILVTISLLPVAVILGGFCLIAGGLPLTHALLSSRRKVEKWPDRSLQDHIAALERELGIAPFHGSGTIEVAGPAPEIAPTKGRLLTPEDLQKEKDDAFLAKRSPETLEALKCFKTLPKTIKAHSVWECPCHGDRWWPANDWTEYLPHRERGGNLLIPGDLRYRDNSGGPRIIEWEKLPPGEYPPSRYY